MPITKDAFLRHTLYYESVLRQADNLYLQGRDGVVSGLNRFDLEWINIQVGQKRSEQLADADKKAAQLCCDYPDAGVNLLHLRLHPAERIRWLKSAIDASIQLNDQKMRGVHLGSLGVAYSDLSELRHALECYEQLLYLVRAAGDISGEAQALGNYGSAYFQLNDFHKAIEYYTSALTLFQKLGDRKGESQALQGLGIVHGSMGEASRAITFFEQHLRIAIETGDREGEGAALGNLGIAYRLLGETSRAIEFYKQRLGIAREIDDKRGEANTLGNLGNAYNILGEHNQALVVFSSNS